MGRSMAKGRRLLHRLSALVAVQGVARTTAVKVFGNIADTSKRALWIRISRSPKLSRELGARPPLEGEGRSPAKRASGVG